MRKPRQPRRPGAAAVEFAVVAPLLFLVFAGLMEFSQAMTTLSLLANAARAGARAGAVTPGDYSAIDSAVKASLAPAGLDGATQLTVVVNSAPVTNDATFRTHAAPGAPVSVQVSVPYNRISWLPGRFLGASTLAETVVMRKEG